MRLSISKVSLFDHDYVQYEQESDDAIIFKLNNVEII